MSAFVVSKAHIDAIVTGALELSRGLYDVEDPDKFGALLWLENERSVAWLYRTGLEREAALESSGYRFERRRVPLTQVELIKAIQCLEYQSCEHPSWEGSEAKRFLGWLMSSAISRLPGYDAAQWEVS